MPGYVSRADLSVAEPIAAFAEESLRAHQIDTSAFWEGVSSILHDLGTKNTELLRAREELQSKIDEFHRAHPGTPDPERYKEFLTEVGYLVPEPETFAITTENVAPEIASLAGPQLVVPILNARFALNAANARWGSLYDALYGTDAIPQQGEPPADGGYDERRGEAVIAYGRELLDSVARLQNASHADVAEYRVEAGRLLARLNAGEIASLSDPEAFLGHTGHPSSPSVILLQHHGIHIEIVIDREGNIGSRDPAGVQDLVLESALSTIMDLEDSVAAVDAEDKALGYRNWRGLMNGTLTETVTKGGRTFSRKLAHDREYLAPDGSPFSLPGRSVLFVRNVGHLMKGSSILDRNSEETFEGIVDAIMTALGALDDVGSEAVPGRLANSRTRSIYIVKPKMHGPAEVAFTVELFARVERLLGLPKATLKVGIMDEERRTSANLAACIAAASDRVVFINTGFLDRTGDEIHTSMYAGPFPTKAEIRERSWIAAYESRNVAIGIACGLDGKAQIGKGMWAMPDLMRDMLQQKVGHVRSGASTAWVPSPTAATLHALHYHQVDAFAMRQEQAPFDPLSLDALLEIPLAEKEELTPEDVQTELENSVQSVLGYVVRWIDQGIGCSKVPDIHDVALMEDRATLRISSQLLANWLLHGVITESQVDAALQKYAAVVDRQNAQDPAYEPLLPTGRAGTAYTAARRLILEGAAQPSGYTEPLLHELRLAKKAGAR